MPSGRATSCRQCSREVHGVVPHDVDDAASVHFRIVDCVYQVAEFGKGSLDLVAIKATGVDVVGDSSVRNDAHGYEHHVDDS